ncbi:MAG: AraC family transcriptional regulator [Williamsia sp.]|nr:AraC family transcriptional regulator [Williamsia sp.]
MEIFAGPDDSGEASQAASPAVQLDIRSNLCGKDGAEEADWVKRPAPGSVRQVKFRQIVQYFGKKDDGFYVIDSAWIPCKPSLLRPFKTDDFSFMVVDRGSIAVKLDKKIYTLSKNSVLLKRPTGIMQVQRISPDCHFRLFGFSSQFISASGLPKKHLEALSFLSSYSEPDRTLQPGETTRVLSILDLLQHKQALDKKELYYDEAIYHAFCLFALEIAVAYSRNEHDHFSSLTRKEHLAYEFFKQLPLHIQNDRSVSYYANLLHVTPKHLSKTIKEVTGKTSGEIIDEMVVQEAKVLLDDPSLSVSQVADKLNFTDQFSFSKFFKKHTSTPPSVYRTVI